MESGTGAVQARPRRPDRARPRKLNQLWIEAKVKSDVDAKSAFWGYYTALFSYNYRQVACSAE
jgi:hypothetical protein